MCRPSAKSGKVDTRRLECKTSVSMLEHVEHEVMQAGDYTQSALIMRVVTTCYATCHRSVMVHISYVIIMYTYFPHIFAKVHCLYNQDSCQDLVR